MAPLAAIVSVLGPALVEVLGRVIPDKNKAQEVAAEALERLQGMDLEVLRGQIEINKLEAASGNRIASLWRPLIGLACAVGFWLTFVLGPFLHWVAQVVYWVLTDFQGPIPLLTLDTETLITLACSMMGLSVLRGFEKAKGVSK